MICHYGVRRGKGVHIPRLAVHQNLLTAAVLVELIESLADCVHCGDVVKSHKVKAEAVDVVFLCPVGYGINHIFSEHKVLGSGVVATARAVRKAAVGINTVVVVRHGVLEPRVGREGVVINHVHYNADSGIMERLDHLLALFDSGVAVVGICRI